MMRMYSLHRTYSSFPHMPLYFTPIWNTPVARTIEPKTVLQILLMLTYDLKSPILAILNLRPESKRALQTYELSAGSRCWQDGTNGRIGPVS